DVEVKWTKVSPSKIKFNAELMDYSFDDDDRHCLALVVPDKNIINHSYFNQNHDDCYYIIYFIMLKVIFSHSCQYKIFIDIKDTLGHEKVRILHDVLCNNAYDFSRHMIMDIKRVHSHDMEQLQLADLLIGALSYLHRGLNSNAAKLSLINRIK